MAENKRYSTKAYPKRAKKQAKRAAENILNIHSKYFIV